MKVYAFQIDIAALKDKITLKMCQNEAAKSVRKTLKTVTLQCFCMFLANYYSPPADSYVKVLVTVPLL